MLELATEERKRNFSKADLENQTLKGEKNKRNQKPRKTAEDCLVDLPVIVLYNKEKAKLT